MILDEFEIAIMPDMLFDKRLKTDPETDYPIPIMNRKGPGMYDGIISVYYLGIPAEPSVGNFGGSLACSPTLRTEHDLLVWAAKNETKIREEFGDERS